MKTTTCPKCGSTKIQTKFKIKKPGFRYTRGIIFPYVKDKYTCKKCGNKWD